MQLPRANNGFWELLFSRVIVIYFIVLKNVSALTKSTKESFQQLFILFSYSVCNVMPIVRRPSHARTTAAIHIVRRPPHNTQRRPRENPKKKQSLKKTIDKHEPHQRKAL